MGKSVLQLFLLHLDDLFPEGFGVLVFELCIDTVS
jgi:hypothetical protein